MKKGALKEWQEKRKRKRQLRDWTNSQSIPKEGSRIRRCRLVNSKYLPSLVLQSRSEIAVPGLHQSWWPARFVGGFCAYSCRRMSHSPRPVRGPSQRDQCSIGIIHFLCNKNQSQRASLRCTNLVSKVINNEDDLEMLAILEGSHVFLFLSPPACLKCVEPNCLCIDMRPEVEGNISPIMLATGKVRLEVHPGSGRDKQKIKWEVQASQSRVLPPLSPFPWS